MNLNYIGLGIVRNLSKYKGFTIAALAKEKNFACHTRYVDEIRFLSPEVDEAKTLSWLLDKAQSATEKGFIFPTSESEIEFLIKYEQSLSSHYVLSIPNKAIAQQILDKYYFYILLKQYGFDTPETYLIQSFDSLRSLPGDLSFPFVMKPVFSGDWKTLKASSYIGSQKAIVVNSLAEVHEVYQRLSVISARMILQKMIQSEEEDTFSYCCYADDQGHSLWGMVSQKILQYPPGFGTAVLSQMVSHPEIYQMGEKLVRAIGINGILEVEIIREQGTGRLFVIEINTRHWQQHIIATKTGLNLSLLDIFFRTGSDNKMQGLIEDYRIRAKQPFDQLIWIDDMSYLLHIAKNLLNLRACHLMKINPFQIVPSVFSVADPVPFFFLLKEKLFGR
jgi:predicted ATP-grasp superfamily ATP-dependent carboligase